MISREEINEAIPRPISWYRFKQLEKKGVLKRIYDCRTKPVYYTKETAELLIEQANK